MGFKTVAIIVSFALFASLLISVPAHAQIIDITLDTPVTGQISTTSETKQYRILLSGDGPLFVHLDKGKSWYSKTAVYQGTLTSQPVKSLQAWEDQMLMLDATVAGTYYIAVSASSSSYLPADYTLTVRRSLDAVTLGQGKTGRISGSQDVFWYQIAVSGNGPLFVNLDKVTSWYGGAAVYQGTLNSEPLRSSVSWEDRMVMVDATITGTYYIAAYASSSSYLPADFTLTVRRSLDAATLGQGKTGRITGTQDIFWYEIAVSGSAPLFVNLDKVTSWYGGVAVYQSTLNSQPLKSSIGWDDRIVMVDATITGTYYIAAYASSSSYLPADFTLTVRRSLDAFTLGQGKTGKISGTQDVFWYEIAFSGSGPLFVNLDKVTSWYGGVAVYQSTLNSQPLKSSIGWDDRMVMVDATITGTYYMAVYASSSSYLPADFTLTVRRSLDALTLAQGKTGKITGTQDVFWYELVTSGSGPLFVNLDKVSSWYGGVAVYQGTLNSEPLKNSVNWEDQMVMVDAAVAGTYYITAYASSSSYLPAGFTLTALRSLPDVRQQLTNQRLAYYGDANWYQATITSPGPLVVRVDKVGTWNGQVRVKKGSLPNATPYMSDSGTANLEVAVLAAEAGIYYIQVISNSSTGGQYTILAASDLSKATKQLTLENQYVHADLSIARGCITSLIYRQGSNQELISATWGKYLMDFGSQDTQLRQQLSTGWSVSGANVQTDYVEIRLSHPLGFANRLTISWQQAGHIEARCDITAPQEVEICGNISPGAGFHANSDRWAVPEETAVKAGIFSYPSGYTSIYPSTDSTQWAAPPEGWMAFWSDGIDEVHGFTFSGGHRLKIANGAATDLHFKIPAGVSRLAFHVVKPKPGTPHSAIQALSAGPYFSLTKQANRQAADTGDEIAYTISYRNSGIANATGVILEDALPSNLELSSGSISGGGLYDPAARRITWNIGSLASKAAVQSVTFRGKVPAVTGETGTISNLARIWSTEESIGTTAMSSVLVAMVSDLTLGEARTVTFKSGDVLRYRLIVPEAANLFATLQKVESAWNCSASFKQNGVVLAKAEGSSDLILQVQKPQAGEYLLEIVATAAGKLRVLASTSLPEVKLSELFVGTIYHNDGFDWAQMDVPAGIGALQFTVETVGNISYLDVWCGSIGSSEHWYASQGFNPPVRMTVQNPPAGRYYLRTSDHGILQGSQIRDYSVRVQVAQPLITINNDFVRIEIDPNRACITGLVFKKGSNAELIEKQWGHYLLDLGADATRGSRLSSGWEVESDERDASYVKLSLKHPSGFANKMALSWTGDRVDVACDMTVPETVSTYPSFRPGGGWEASRDKWAFPTSSGVKTGSFAYPGGTTRAIFPADGSFQIPSEGWIALWDDQVDEVYGFTFSDGYSAAIWNGAAADPFLRFPVGSSRVGFHIVKGKPANPYEAIRSIAKRPTLSLTKQVNALFAVGGGELSYTLTFSNTGQSNATNVVLEVTLAAGVELVSGSISNGGTYDPATRKITWMLSSIAYGAQAQSVTFKAKLKEGLVDGTLVNVPARIWCAEQPAATETTFVTTIGTPIITAISPNKGGNAGIITIIIDGRQLDPNAKVRLTRAGEPDILAQRVGPPPAYPLTGATFISGTRLLATFDLSGKSAGLWNMNIANPSGGVCSLASAFEIGVGGRPRLNIAIQGITSVRVGREGVFWIWIENIGDVDATDIVFTLTLPDGVDLISVQSDSVAEPWSPYRNIDVSLQKISQKQKGLLAFFVAKIPVETKRGLKLAVKISSPTGLLEMLLKAYYGTVGKWLCYTALLLKGYSPEEAQAEVERRWKEFINGEIDNIKPVREIAEKFGGALNERIGAGLELKGYSDALNEMSGLGEDLNKTFDCGGEVSEGGRGSHGVQGVTPLDPNDKDAPSGYDAAGVGIDQLKHHISSDRPFHYMIHFENLKSATAAVQDMAVLDQLDSHLDWPTFTFEAFQVGTYTVSVPQGTRSFTQNVDLRPELPAIVQVSGTFNSTTGVVQWYLKGIDPYTGLLADFLPPNTDSVAPRGEGWVSYSVKPKANLPTGTVIKNKATIDFEVGVPPAPMDTPEVFNTIDSTRPASQVLPFNGTGCASFEVKWSGTDEGSGIRNYTIHVSDNGAAYQQWISNTVETHATFAGTAGHTYAFYSVAQDNVGNTEEAPSKADATNTVTGSLTLSAESQTFPSTGGTDSFDVTTSTGCPWTAASNAAWITITSGSSGSGNGKVSYSVAASNGSARTGTISVAGRTFTVKQQSGLVRRKDLIGSWAGQGVYWRNSDTGEWAYVGSYATRVSAGDLDGDGVDDILGAWAGSGLWVKYSSTGQWTLMATPPDWIAVGDMNSDGKLDLLGIWAGVIWVRDGGTSLWATLSSGADRIEAGDIDGDGKADLIGNWPGNGVWVKHSTTGQWELLASPAEWIATGDLNGDSKVDLLGIWDGTIWSRDTATGQWTALSYGADKIAAGDLDADGKADLIGNWPDSGVWVKYSTTQSWERLASVADSISTGRLR